PLQGAPAAADPPLHPAGRGAQPPPDHLRVRARLARGGGLPPAGGALRVRAGADGGPAMRSRGEGPALGDDPIDERLLADFYRPPPERRLPRAARPRPTHYKIVCISLYTEDIARLEGLVAELKRRGHTKANKSQLIRAALDQVDLAKIPKGY